MTGWQDIIARALHVERTPLYIFAWDRISDAVQELDCHKNALPTRHWLSLKTQPLKPLLDAWLATGQGVEVVTEFELLAAQAQGFSKDQILVNGVAKHYWLEQHVETGMRVHFDSISEINALKQLAAKYQWRVGLRVHVTQEHDPDEPSFKAQFGMTKEECHRAASALRKAGVNVEGIHFHLRSNVEAPEIFGEAVREIKDLCSECMINPQYLDCGGGLPSPDVVTINGAKSPFELCKYFEVLSERALEIPSVEELWLENGRFVTARSGVLVIRVLDIKERNECRYLICDGGRTNHALVSDWETHRLEVFPDRQGEHVLSTVCGPTCMAFDRLCRVMLPRSVMPGDVLIWHNAGAYHLPWETRFSYGLAPVLWVPEFGPIQKVRDRESFNSWWGQWKTE